MTELASSLANNSRYKFTQIFLGDDETTVAARGAETTFLANRTAISYRDSADNILHVVREGDTLHKLANKFFRGFPLPATLWWVIAEFQDPPINDPTRKLEPGSFIIIPSPNLVGSLVSTDTLNRIP